MTPRMVCPQLERVTRPNLRIWAQTGVTSRAATWCSSTCCRVVRCSQPPEKSSATVARPRAVSVSMAPLVRIRTMKTPACAWEHTPWILSAYRSSGLSQLSPSALRRSRSTGSPARLAAGMSGGISRGLLLVISFDLSSVQTPTDDLLDVMQHVAWDVPVRITHLVLPESRLELLDQRQAADPLDPLVAPLGRWRDEAERAAMLRAELGPVQSPGEQTSACTMQREATRVPVADRSRHHVAGLGKWVGRVDQPGGGDTFPDAFELAPTRDTVQGPGPGFEDHRSYGICRTDDRRRHQAVDHHIPSPLRNFCFHVEDREVAREPLDTGPSGRDPQRLFADRCEGHEIESSSSGAGSTMKTVPSITLASYILAGLRAGPRTTAPVLASKTALCQGHSR